MLIEEPKKESQSNYPQSIVILISILILILTGLIIVFAYAYYSSNSNFIKLQEQVDSCKSQNQELARINIGLQGRNTNLTMDNFYLSSQLNESRDNASYWATIADLFNKTIISQQYQIKELQETNKWLLIGTTAGGVLATVGGFGSLFQYFQAQALANKLAELTPILYQLGNSSYSQTTAIKDLSKFSEGLGINVQDLTTASKTQTYTINKNTNSITNLNNYIAQNLAPSINQVIVSNQILSDLINNQNKEIKQLSLATQNLTDDINNQSTKVDQLNMTSQDLIRVVSNQTIATQQLNDTIQRQNKLIEDQTKYIDKMTLNLWSLSLSNQTLTSYYNNTWNLIVDDAIMHAAFPAITLKKLYDSFPVNIDKTRFLNSVNKKNQTVTLIFTDIGYIFGVVLNAPWNTTEGQFIMDPTAYSFSVNQGVLCPIKKFDARAAIITRDSVVEFGDKEIAITEIGIATTAANRTYVPYYYPSGINNVTFYAGASSARVVRFAVYQYTVKTQANADRYPLYFNEELLRKMTNF